MSRPRMLVVVAGLPGGVLGPFIGQLKKSNPGLEALKTLPLDSVSYTAQYAEDLYGLVGSGLRKIPDAGRDGWWGISLVVLYSRKSDGNDHHHLVERFDMEALLAPLVMEPIERKAPRRHREGATVNELISQSTPILRKVRMVLGTLALEVTNRDSRTCVLLPRANFGDGFDKVKDCVHGAVAHQDSEGTQYPEEMFKNRLKAVAARLPKTRPQKITREYFQSGRLVFEAPAKAGARHGFAPSWNTKAHNDRCVIRGHFRFGVPYDPRFHYDCKLARNSDRRFTSCHGEEVLKPGRLHVNIAPNDNIR